MTDRFRDLSCRISLFLALATAFYANAPGQMKTETATFAGGCFWCMEPPFDELKGVLSTTSGYTGGTVKNPTYEEVSAGTTGHAESIQIIYDPTVVSYQKLLEVYWKNIDPTTRDRQFCDSGKQYRPAIFYHNESQKKLAEESKREVEKKPALQGRVHTEIVPLTQFYPAEEYHQDFYKKNPSRYYSYRKACERDKRLEEIWGK